MADKPCGLEDCEDTFDPKNPLEKYCSDDCRKKAAAQSAKARSARRPGSPVAAPSESRIVRLLLSQDIREFLALSEGERSAIELLIAAEDRDAVAEATP